MDLPIPPPLAATGIATVAVAWGAAYGLSQWRRSRNLRAIREANPPLRTLDAEGHADPDPLWLIEFGDLTAMAHALTTEGLDALDELYQAGHTRSHRRVARVAFEVALWANRLEWTEHELEMLKEHSPAAQLAAVAVLTRDLMTQSEFALLTQMWAAAGLPLPGGDVCTHFTVLTERETVDGWEVLVGPEIVRTLTGESAEQVARGVAGQLIAAQRADVGAWRVRVWSRAVTDLPVLLCCPADAECQPERTGR